MRTGFILAGVGAALIIILGIQFWPDNEEGSAVVPPLESAALVPAASPPVQTAAGQEAVAQRDEAAAVETPPAAVLPPLRESDDWVREALAGSTKKGRSRHKR